MHELLERAWGIGKPKRHHLEFLEPHLHAKAALC